MSHLGPFATATLVLLATITSAAYSDDKKLTPAEYAARVVEKAGKAQSVRIVMKAGEDMKTAEEGIYFFRRDLGVRMEQRDPKTGYAVKIAIASLKAEKWIMLDFKKKAATARRFIEQQMETEGRDLVPVRLAMSPDIKAGDDEKIDDRTVKVLEGVSKGLPARVWTMWVDAKTELPVRVKMEKPGPNGKVVAMQFNYTEWDKELDAKLFAAELSEGYKFVPIEKK